MKLGTVAYACNHNTCRWIKKLKVILVDCPNFISVTVRKYPDEEHL